MSPPELSRRERADVVIVGGGPAGSAATRRLASQGRHVVQLEQRIFGAPGYDRWRSGEGLLPATFAALRRLGVTSTAAEWTRQSARRVKIRWPGGDLTVDRFPHAGCIRALDREAFDAALWRAAATAGADSRVGWRVRRLLVDGTAVVGVQATNPDGEQVQIDAPLVIDAGGRNALSLTQFDLRRRELGDDFVAIVLFFENVPEFADDAWEMHFFNGDAPTVVQGARLTPNIIRFGLGAYLRLKQGSRLPPEAFFWNHLRACPPLHARLRQATIVAPPYARARLSYDSAQLARSGLLVIGDAAGYLNPILGDGILMALRSAELATSIAARAFECGDFSLSTLGAYDRGWRRARRVHRLIGHALIAAFQHPQLLDRLGHHSLLRRLLLGMLMRPGDRHAS